MSTKHMDVERQQAIEIKQFTMEWCRKDDRVAALSYFGTFAVYFLTLWLAIVAAFSGLWWVAAPLVVLNAFSGVRLYVLQHDCGHHSLFSTKRLNELAGYGLSTFTLTPFRAMQVNHNDHHSHISDLDERETTEIYTMTVREWERAGALQRLAYRIYRNPAFMLPVGGAFTYILRYRWPKKTLEVGLWEVMAQNAVLLAWVGLIYALAGTTGLWVYLATVLVAGFPIIADSDLEISKTFDMLPADAYLPDGRTAADSASVRSVFIVSPDKKLQLSMTYPMSVGRNFAEVLRALDGLQATYGVPIATPANWTVGQDVIVSLALDDAAASAKFGEIDARLPYLRFTKQPG